MRPYLRLVAPLLLAIGVATCSDAPIAAVRQGATPAHAGAAKLDFAPVFSKSAEAIANQLPSLGLPFNNVRVVIHGMPDTTTIVLDTIVTYSQAADSDLVLDLTVKVDVEGQRFNVGLDYRNGDTPLFHGSAVVTSYQPGQPAPPQVDVPIEFVGPGSTAKSVSVTPKSITISGTQSTTLSAVALDQSGNPINGAVIEWTSSDPSIATVSLTGGVVQALGRRGDVTITASTPTGVSGNASVGVVLPPASIAVVSGAGQSGKVHTALSAPVVVQVSASDGVGVASASVVFSAPTGGAVGASSVITDASGRASTTLTLGTVAGPQGFAATAAGFSAGINETATAGDPSAIAIVSGNGQTDTVRKALAPLSVKVTDQFSNPVPNASVSWAKTSGGGTLGSATSATGADGVASNSYTLGTTPGAEGVSASIGSAGSVSFSFTTLPAAPAAIAAVSGGDQSGRAGTVLAAPFVVKVTDASGNPTPNVAVAWSATNGSIGASTTTGADGTTSNSMTLGTTVGQATATATVAGHSASFSATVQPGVVAKLSITTQPTSGTAGVTMSPVAVALLDQFGNATPAVNAVSIALGSNSAGATLSGTLTRSAVNGVATFDDLKLDKVGTGFTLVATSGNAGSITTSAFNMVSSGAATMQILDGTTQQPIPSTQAITVNAMAGVAPANAPIVKITDVAGQPVQGVAVTFTGTGTSPTHTISGTLSTNAQGEVPLASAIEVADTYTITATAAGLSGSPRTATLVVSAAAASKLAFSVEPTNTAQSAHISPAVVVQVQDQFGNLVTTDTRQITMAIVSGTGTTNATLSGTTQVNASSGAATFSDLSIGTVGTGYELTAIAGTTLAPATSSAFNVTSTSLGSMLVLDGTTGQPIAASTSISLSLTAGVTPSSPPVLELIDANGQPVANATISLTAVGAHHSAAGPVVTNQSGIAVFVGAIDTADVYTVTATPPSGYTGGPRAATVTVGPAAAAKLAFAAQPTSAAAGTHMSPAVTVQIQDQFGNLVANDTRQVDLSITSGTGTPGAALAGTSQVASGVVQQTAAASVATFSDLSIATAGTGYTLTASSTPALTSAVSTSFSVSSTTVASITLSSAAGLAVTAGGSLSSAPTATVRDGSGNVLVGVSVTLAVKEGTAVFGSRSIATDALGQVSFGALTSTDLPTTAGAYTITASSGAVSSNPVSLTVSAGPASKIKLTPTNSGPPAGAEVSVIAMATDAFGNFASDASTRTISWTTSGGSFDGSPTNMSNGIGSALFISPSTGGTARVTATDQSASPLTAGTADISTVSGGLQLAISGSAPANTGVAGASVGAPAVKATRSDGVTPVSGITVKFAVLTGGGKVQLTSGSTGADAISLQTDGSGIASIAAWTLGSSAGSNSLQITAAGSSNSITHTSTSSAGSATTMSAFNGTSYSLTAGATAVNPPGILVTDANSNPVSGVSIHLVTTITGTNTVLRTDDVATNSSGKIDLSGYFTTSAGSYTVVATNSSLTGSGLSFSITINPATANKLAFGTQPTSVNAGSSISPAVTVQIEDQYGNVVTSSSATVTLALQTAAGATLTGGSATATSGIATFSSLSVDLANSYQLVASSSGLASATSSSFTVSAGSVSGMSLVRGGGSDAPTSANDDEIFSASSSGPKVQLVDANGNPVSLQNITISASVVDASFATTGVRRAPRPGPFEFSYLMPPAVTLTPGSAITDMSGVADFTGAKLNGTVGDLAIQFSATVNGHTFTLYTGHSLHLNHGKAKTATCTATLPGRVSLSHTLSVSPKLHLVDADNNIVDNTSETFTTSTGGSLSATAFTSDANGDITGPTWKVGSTAGTHTVGISGATGTCSVNASAIDHIKLTKRSDGSTVSSLGSLKNGDAIPDIDATVVDALGNPIEDQTFAISVTGDSHSGQGISISSSGNSDSHGKKSFAGLTVDGVLQSGATLDYASDISGVTGQISFDIADGDDATLDVVGNGGSTAFSVTLENNQSVATVSIKDHDKRNSKNSPGVVITWTLGAACTDAGFGGLTGPTSTTSTTDNSGQAVMPDLFLGSNFPTVAGSCTVVVSGTSGTTTLTPLTLTLNR